MGHRMTVLALLEPYLWFRWWLHNGYGLTMGQILTRGDLRKLYNRLLKPIRIRSFALAVLGVAIVLGLVTVLCLVVLYQSQPSLNFMRTEELKFVSVTFPSDSSAVVSVRNVGTSPLTIARVTINNTARTATYSFRTDGTLQPGDTGTITISDWAWTQGSTYEFAVLTATGKKFMCAFTAPPGVSIPIPVPDDGPSPIDSSRLIVASLIETIVIVTFAGVVVLDRKHYLRSVPVPALAVLGILMILGLLVALWLVVSYSYHP